MEFINLPPPMLYLKPNVKRTIKGLSVLDLFSSGAANNETPPPIYDEKGVRLEFAQFGHFDSFEVFRSLTSMAGLSDADLPAPIGSGLKTMRFMDTVDLKNVLDRDLYYRVRVKRGNEVMISDEMHAYISTFEAPQNLTAVYEDSAIVLGWDFQSVDNYKYYCSETEIDPLNLPAPKFILAGDVRTYVDTDVEIGKTYYVRIGSVKNGVEKLSAIVSIATSGLSQTLKNLFAANEKGFAYNFQDLSTLWQDVDGTIPVAAIDDYIARVDDLSGNNNHLIQSNQVIRPQLKQDNSGFYLWFDGTKALYSENIVDFNSLVNYTALCRFSKELSSTGCILEASVNMNNNTASFAMFQESQNISFTNSGSGYNSAQVQLDADSLFIGVMKVLENPKIKMMRVNGIEKTRTGILNQSTWGLLNHNIYVGARGGTSLFLTSKVRAIAFVGRELTSSEILNIESLLMP